MANAFPSFTNPFIPSSSTNAKITANLVMNYGRNIDKFKVLKYSTITKVALPVGYYTRLAAGAGWRVNPAQGNGNLWTPGQDRPTGEWNQQGFTRVIYETTRYAFSTTLDTQTVDVSDFEIEPAYFHMIAQQSMTSRIYNMSSVATTSGNYPTSHVSTATSLAGGFLGSGTGSAPYLQKAIQQATIRISKSTGGQVSNPSQMMLITNPNGAAAMSRAEETREYLARQEGAIQVLKGEGQTNATMYNIPDNYYGCQVIVEDTVINTGAVSAENNLDDSAFVWPDNTVLICARPDKLVWPEGSTGNIATLGFLEYEPFSAETQLDSWNRRVKMSISDQYQAQVISPITGFLVTSAFS